MRMNSTIQCHTGGAEEQEDKQACMFRTLIVHYILNVNMTHAIDCLKWFGVYTIDCLKRIRGIDAIDCLTQTYKRCWK